MGYEIDFLAVGEESQSGDAIVMRFGNLFGGRDEQQVVVIDGGFTDTGDDIVEHINQFYGTNRVDLVISSHPDLDHTAGLVTVLEDMEVAEFWIHKPWDHVEEISHLFTDGRVTDNSIRERLRNALNKARELVELAESKNIPIVEPFHGISNSTQQLSVLGPSRDYYQQLLPLFLEPEVRIDAQGGIVQRAIRAVEELVTTVAERWDFETLELTPKVVYG